MRLGLRLMDGALLAALTLAGLGHLLRDRVVAFAALTYAPLALIAGATLLYGLARRGQQLGGWWGTGLAAAGLGWALTHMIGWHAAPPASAPRPPLRVVQQNVWWGGGERSPGAWAEIQDALLARRPDVLLLSEAPPEDWLRALEARLEGWSTSLVEHPPGATYWYRLAVLSRWPHEDARVHRWPDGAAIAVTLRRPGGPIRVMLVDGKSAPGRDRVAFLSRVHAALRAAKPPVDILAGDFNAPARSVGFAALSADHWLATETCGDWRGTWPRRLPLVDVDHLWLRRGWTAACDIVSTPRCDHRGIVAVVR